MREEVERKNGSMPDRAFFRSYWTRINGKLFLWRFIVWFTRDSGCTVNWIRQPDDQRKHPHDHSASFLSVRLLGGYEEDVFTDPSDLSVREHRVHPWLSGSVLKYTEAHSITKISRFPLVTLLITWKRRQESSYWTPEGKILTGVNKKGIKE